MRFCCGRCSAALTTMSLNAGSYDMRFLGFPLGTSRACGMGDEVFVLCSRQGARAVLGALFMVDFRFVDEIRRKY